MTAAIDPIPVNKGQQAGLISDLTLAAKAVATANEWRERAVLKAYAHGMSLRDIASAGGYAAHSAVAKIVERHEAERR